MSYGLYKFPFGKFANLIFSGFEHSLGNGQEQWQLVGGLINSITFVT